MSIEITEGEGRIYLGKLSRRELFIDEHKIIEGVGWGLLYISTKYNEQYDICQLFTRRDGRYTYDVFSVRASHKNKDAFAKIGENCVDVLKLHKISKCEFVNGTLVLPKPNVCFVDEHRLDFCSPDTEYLVHRLDTEASTTLTAEKIDSDLAKILRKVIYCR